MRRQAINNKHPQVNELNSQIDKIISEKHKFKAEFNAKNVAAAAKDKEIRALFEKLAHMELGHKNKLENVFVEIGYPEVF